MLKQIANVFAFMGGLIALARSPIARGAESRRLTPTIRT